MKLSKDFYLEEFLRSQTAVRHDIDVTPNEFVLNHLDMLVKDIMQPLRDEIGRAVIITSGYRPYELNNLIGGAPASAHLTGRACDFVVNGRGPCEVIALLKSIEEAWAKTDKAIDEFERWTHVQIAQEGKEPRREHLTARRVEGKTVYAYA